MKVESKVCLSCKCPLDESNRSDVDAELCNACFDAEIAELEAEDSKEDSMTDAERLADFRGE